MTRSGKYLLTFLLTTLSLAVSGCLGQLRHFQTYLEVPGDSLVSPFSQGDLYVAPAIAFVPYDQPQQSASATTHLGFGRIKGGQHLGNRTLVFDTERGPVEIALIGYGSMMLTFDQTVIHVNPWLEVAGYNVLPKADQIWITDARPEHLDLRAIRQLSQDTTEVIVDPGSATALDDLIRTTMLHVGDTIERGAISLQAVPAYATSAPGGSKAVQPGVGYIARFGEFSIYIAGDTEPIPEMAVMDAVHVALLPTDGLYSMDASQAAEAARMIRPQVIIPYQIAEEDPAVVASHLQGTGIVVWPFFQPSMASAKPLTQPIIDQKIGSPGFPFVDELRPGVVAPFIAARDDPEQLLLPDLQTLAPYDLVIRPDFRNGETLIRLSNTIQNTGAGNLELEGISDPTSGKTYVTQRIHARNGAIHPRLVGEFVYHPGHYHWHFDGFTVYELWSLTVDGTLDAMLRSSGKVSFCLRDISRTGPFNPENEAAYTSCGQSIQGISNGWVDTYKYWLIDQSINIEGIPDGIYAVLSTADPYNLVQESDETNNIAMAYVRIQNGVVTELDRAGAVAAKAAEPPG